MRCGFRLFWLCTYRLFTAVVSVTSSLACWDVICCYNWRVICIWDQIFYTFLFLDNILFFLQLLFYLIRALYYFLACLVRSVYVCWSRGLLSDRIAMISLSFLFFIQLGFPSPIYEFMIISNISKGPFEFAFEDFVTKLVLLHED